MSYYSNGLSTKYEAVPRRPLAHLPTPLEYMPRLSKALGIDLHVKRDDLTGLAFGGNKVRKLEFIIQDAIAQGATMLLATAAAQSNFCRVTAAAARKAGLRVGLSLRGTPELPNQGNLLVDRILDAEIRFVDEPDPYSPVHAEHLKAWAEDLCLRGETPYHIDLHNDSYIGALATLGYVVASDELGEQCKQHGIQPKHVYAAVGSGSTHAGLLVGLRQGDNPAADSRVQGVAVGPPTSEVVPRIRAFMDSVVELLGLNPIDERLLVDGYQRGPGYGVPTDSGVEAIQLAAECEALLLNPVYTAKAMAGLIADVRSGTIKPGETVIFINTGGDPLIFSYADMLANAAERPELNRSPGSLKSG